LVSALRERLAQQQQVISTYKTRDARLAAMVRSVAYSRQSGGGGMPMGGMPFGGGGSGSGGGSSPLSGLSGLSSLAAGFNPRTSGGASGLVAPAGVAGAPLGALTPNSSQREVAAAIIHEARRRGYSPQRTLAILSTGLQESNLNPRAVSPNKLWESIFQQDSSYAGRRNPNLAIAEFFNRLDELGGRSSPDIWKSIFWLQQRPGDPSAEIAYDRGRQGYLTEVMRPYPRAVALYRDIVGPAV
jgi:hypothetical protein